MSAVFPRWEDDVEHHVVSRRALLSSLLGVGAAGAAAAQQTVLPPSSGGIVQFPPPDLPVVSGAEFGFRVERVRRDGVRVGTLVVKEGERWVEAEIGYGMRRGT